jgi:hypothetical protein
MVISGFLVGLSSGDDSLEFERERALAGKATTPNA